jgi:hypothetical protein
MHTAILRKKKRAVALATLHALFWLWLLYVLDKKFPEHHSPIFLVGGIGFMVALWIGYRSVLALRRFEKTINQPPEPAPGSVTRAAPSPDAAQH